MITRLVIVSIPFNALIEVRLGLSWIKKKKRKKKGEKRKKKEGNFTARNRILNTYCVQCIDLLKIYHFLQHEQHIVHLIKHQLMYTWGFEATQYEHKQLSTSG